MSTAATFAAVAVTLYAAHNLADHVLGQTDMQAAEKAKPGGWGWTFNILHVAQYHAVLAVMLLVATRALHLPVTGAGFAAGMGFSAVTHAFLDRRWPVRWLLEHTGSRGFASRQTPICGMYQADQALHVACLWISSLLMAAL